MTIDALLNAAKMRLNTSDSHESPRKNFICEALLAHFLGKSRVFLHAHGDFGVDFKTARKMLNAINALNCGTPLEYITREASFYGEKFFVDSRVLIPRTETELLLERANALIREKNPSAVFEIGVGSGILSIMLCLLNPNLRITATDISRDALEVAKKNIERFALNARVRLVCADLLGDLPLPKNALIISNPPYIAQNYALPKNVAREPKIALFGGENGDEILRRIIALNADFLACEIGYDQGHLRALLGAYGSVEFYKDYAGFLRGFVAAR